MRFFGDSCFWVDSVIFEVTFSSVKLDLKCVSGSVVLGCYCVMSVCLCTSATRNVFVLDQKSKSRTQCLRTVFLRICFYLLGFPPIPGQKATGAEHGFVAALVAADKLASTGTAELADEEDEEKEDEVGYHQLIIIFFDKVYVDKY